jgi:DNA-directed RNA polymerase specialized sigma24 family protein
MLDDAAVIRLSLDEPERFEVLFLRHAPRVQRYVARRLGAGAADDIVAETFLLAFRVAVRDRHQLAQPPPAGRDTPV